MKPLIYSIATLIYILLNLLPFIVAYKYDILPVILLSPLVALFAQYIFNDILRVWNI